VIDRKRKKAEVVQVNLRIREALRRQLKREAEENNRTFNQEMVQRITDSFLHDQNAVLLKVLLAPDDNVDFLLLRMCATVIASAGKGWHEDKTRAANVVEALSRLAALFGELVDPDTFQRGEEGSADELVYTAIKVDRIAWQERFALTGERP
jgi:hypothetical protein